MLYQVFGSCRVSGDENIYDLGIYENSPEELVIWFEQRTKYNRSNGWELEIKEFKPCKIQEIKYLEGYPV